MTTTAACTCDSYSAQICKGQEVQVILPKLKCSAITISNCLNTLGDGVISSQVPRSPALCCAQQGHQWLVINPNNRQNENVKELQRIILEHSQMNLKWSTEPIFSKWRKFSGGYHLFLGWFLQSSKQSCGSELITGVWQWDSILCCCYLFILRSKQPKEQQKLICIKMKFCKNESKCSPCPA